MDFGNGRKSPVKDRSLQLEDTLCLTLKMTRRRLVDEALLD
jgi:hypothetical protein